MLTPIFSLDQCDEFLTFIIKAPYTKISETEIFVDGDDFRFFSKPYFLRLHLPGRLREDGRESAEYDFDRKEFRVRVPKESPGEEFVDLQFISNLLTKKRDKKVGPLIEVLDEPKPNSDADDEDDGEVEEDGDQWLWEQRLEKDESRHFAPGMLINSVPKYGFANKAFGLFSSRLEEERRELTDIPDPDATTQTQRHQLKFQDENKKFCSDHYLADLHDSDDVERILLAPSRWRASSQASVCRLTSGRELSLDRRFTDTEKDTLKNLPRREFLLSPEDKRIALLSLVDVLLASAYDQRTTDGDTTVESGWTINKISSTLSWFIEFQSVKSVISSFLRRSLTFPLYRHWKLSLKCLQDAINIFKQGKVTVVRSLIEIYKCFIDCDPRYLLNDLYITDMIVWVQTVNAKTLQKLGADLEALAAKVRKGDVGFDLEELEVAAELVLAEDDEESGGEDSDTNSDSDDVTDSEDGDSDSSSELDSDDSLSPPHGDDDSLRVPHNDDSPSVPHDDDSLFVPREPKKDRVDTVTSQMDNCKL